jgi:hypothetical protein
MITGLSIVVQKFRIQSSGLNSRFKIQRITSKISVLPWTVDRGPWTDPGDQHKEYKEGNIPHTIPAEGAKIRCG